MNKTGDSAKEFFTEFASLNKNSNTVIICPPFTLLHLTKDKGFHLGAQNMHQAEKGAFTGEISATQLKDAGVKYVLIGHSERRIIFGETCETVNKKNLQCLLHELIPVVCIGETLEERESGQTNEVLTKQLSIAFNSFSSETITPIVAYEPVWAIGTGKVATLEQISETHQFIRDRLQFHFGNAEKGGSGDRISVLYGGSVTDQNAQEIMSIPNVDGVLVGGASLDAKKFATIVNTQPQI